MNKDIKLYYFKRETTGFSFVFDKWLETGEKIYLRMPAISANKRGVNDIGWMSNAEKGALTISGTFAENPKSDDALWMVIRENDEINKTTAALKIENSGKRCKIEIRAILN
jgi:hypothetical protein